MHYERRCQGKPRKKGDEMKFLKMHGLGNDFVILDAREDTLVLSGKDMREISDRKRGVGCDLITVLEQSDIADFGVQFFNADGSESGACGNASRCVADLYMSQNDVESCTIEVQGGKILECSRIGDLLVEVDMGPARSITDLDLAHGGLSNPVGVDMGNPHCVFFMQSYDGYDLEALGPYFENHEIFPNRSNIEFVQVIDKTHLRQKTWERGVGMTDACGSGACAVAVSAVHRGLAERKVEIELDGGILHIYVRESDGHVLMTGPVAYVFDGEL